MSDKIGVIVPVYKTEKYVAECIESILAQTFTNFRLILVDDGSPDGAGKICDEYAQKDNRITVIHQENAGVTRARAAGVEAADDCEWITFVDSDDTITENALEILYKNTDIDHDIIICCFDDKVKEFGEYVSCYDFKKNLIGESVMFFNTPWGKLFRKTLFDGFTFDTPRSIVIAEDLIMNIRLANNSKNKNIKICQDCIYNYRIRKGSAAQTHKRTHKDEYQINFQKQRSLSTKEYEEHIEASIRFRIVQWQSFWEYKYFCKDMLISKFYIELKNDIVENQYELPLIKKILFFNTNPIIRFFAINTKKIINIYKKYHR